MSEPSARRDLPEVALIDQLLGEVQWGPARPQREPDAPPTPAPAPRREPSPAARPHRSPFEVHLFPPVEGVGWLAAREFFARVNWHNDPARAARFAQEVAPRRPGGEERSVRRVMAAFDWGDE